MKVLVQRNENHTGISRFWFQLHTDNIVVQSIDFPDRTTCIENAYGTLTLLKNSTGTGQEVFISKSGDNWIINISEAYQLQMLQPSTCTDSDDAQAIVNQLLNALNGHLELIDVPQTEESTQNITTPELVDELDEVPLSAEEEIETEIQDIDDSDPNIPYKSDKAGALMINPGSILNPKFSSGAIPQKSPCGPVFKPMEPLTVNDYSLFWGRDQELKDLYQLFLNTNLLLLYGAARSGKSSLVRCGLPNQNKISEWHGIVVERRGDINQAFYHQLEREWKRLLPGNEQLPTSDPLGILEEIQRLNPQPTYLVFDNLEELFIDEPKPEEQEEFFATLSKLVQSDGSIKAILIIDETYLAHLTNYEPVVSNLFEHRYRLEKMSSRGISSGLVDCLDMLNNINTLNVPDPKATTESIMARMSEGKDQIEVACMQIYLNELQQKACKQKQNGQVVIDEKLVENSDSPKKLIEAYLNNQRSTLKQQEDASPENQVALQQQLDELDAIQARCLGASPPTAMVYPSWVSWLGWGLLLFLLLILFWPDKVAPARPVRPDTCLACDQYLKAFGEEAPFGAYSKAQLASYKCQEWADCRIAQEANSCAIYIKYLEKYRTNGSCSDEFLNAVIKTCLLPANTDIINNCKLLTEILPKSNLSKEMLCLVLEEYIAAFGADNSCALILSDFRTELKCKLPDEQANVQLSCATLRAKVKNQGALTEKERSTLEQCACDEAFVKADCNTYEAYLKKYGNNGRCSNDISRALQKLRNLDCPLPMGDICFLTATKEPVPWASAHTQCPQGYKLICESQVKYLLDKFYKNDLRKSYSYMVGKIEASDLTFDADGFWTATEFSDSQAYAIEKDKAGKSIRMPEGIDKSATRPCLCIAPGPKFSESPISDLQCLSKSLSN